MLLPNIHAAAEDIHRGRLTPVDLLETCLASMERLEPKVHAFVHIDRDGARAEAKRLAAELKGGHWRGPLHGIPLGIKDIFDAFDWPTAAGSRLWAQSIARRDATVVERLRRAGAVFVGKTVTTQYASFDPPPTRNPWGLAQTPGGSSSGSAAAVACGMCLGTLASQTGGSITRPAGYCGVPAIKPTHGRVSVDGVVPLAPSMDHVGVMAGCVRDLAILLQTIAGHDRRDPESSDRPVPHYAELLDQRREPPRIGCLRGLFDKLAHPAMRSAMDDVCNRLRKHGAVITEVALPGGFGEVLPRHRIVMAVEAAMYHQPRLERVPHDYDPKITSLLKEGLACPAPEYARCKEHQKQLTHEMQSCFEGVDVLLSPATTGPAPNAGSTGDPAFNSPWSYTGLPVVSFPVGWSPEGLPLSVQLAGPKWSEAGLLAAAAWCESQLGFERHEPKL
ncbi:MAG: amidase [Gemmataceae bacterium]|nr:amidase [Gemmataceae bacterium]